MLPRNHPDFIRIAFDDARLVANAGLILPTTLARRLGLPQLVDRRLGLGPAPFTIDLDLTICETYGMAKEGAHRHCHTGASRHPGPRAPLAVS